MSTENENDISRPHGLQQNIKMELMGMIHSAENPFDIICHIADYLEEVSAEDGYANHVRENLRATAAGRASPERSASVASWTRRASARDRPRVSANLRAPDSSA